jgi:hypothetical protein
VNVVELRLAADAANWQALGLSVADDGTSVIGGIRLRFVDPVPDAGITGWGVDADLAPDEIDGLPTYATRAPIPCGPEAHALAAIGVDHVVVATPDLERTCAAISTSTGAELRRVREVGPMRQGFHRSGELVIEVVTYPDVPAGPATFWGLVLTVADLDGTAERLGPSILGPVKDAVQPGRRISTVRIEAGLGMRIALISPYPPR